MTCECLITLDKVRMLHEEGKVDSMLVAFETTDGIKWAVHKPDLKLLLATIEACVGQIRRMASEEE